MLCTLPFARRLRVSAQTKQTSQDGREPSEMEWSGWLPASFPFRSLLNYVSGEINMNTGYTQTRPQFDTMYQRASALRVGVHTE